MAKKTKAPLTPEALAYFREQGRKGGLIGGKIGGLKAWEKLTPEERSERAMKISRAAAATRWAKKKKDAKGG